MYSVSTDWDQQSNMDAQRMHVWRWHSVRFCVGVTYSCHYKQPHTALTAFDSDKPSCRPDAQPLKSLTGWVTQVKVFSNVQLGTTQPTAASLKRCHPSWARIFTDLHASDTFLGCTYTVQRNACSFMHAGFWCLSRGFSVFSKRLHK